MLQHQQLLTHLVLQEQEENFYLSNETRPNQIYPLDKADLDLTEDLVKCADTLIKNVQRGQPPEISAEQYQQDLVQVIRFFNTRALRYVKNEQLEEGRELLVACYELLSAQQQLPMSVVAGTYTNLAAVNLIKAQKSEQVVGTGQQQESLDEAVYLLQQCWELSQHCELALQASIIIDFAVAKFLSREYSASFRLLQQAFEVLYERYLSVDSNIESRSADAGVVVSLTLLGITIYDLCAILEFFGDYREANRLLVHAFAIVGESHQHFPAQLELLYTCLDERLGANRLQMDKDPSRGKWVIDDATLAREYRENLKPLIRLLREQFGKDYKIPTKNYYF